MALPMATQVQMVEEIAEETGYAKGDVRHILAALEEFVLREIGDSRRVKIAGVVIEPKLKKATKARMGRNPQTGEEVKISAKPASVKVKARVSKKIQEAAPSVKALTRAL